MRGRIYIFKSVFINEIFVSEGMREISSKCKYFYNFHFFSERKIKEERIKDLFEFKPRDRVF